MPLKKVYLELTSSCNLNCSMCYRKTWEYKTHDMNKKIIDKCIKEIKEIRTIKEVVLGGIGEPTYAKDVQTVMHSLKEKYLTLTTNATISNDSLIDSIVECIDRVIISVDGLHESFYKIREISLDKIIQTIEKINFQKKIKNKKTPLILFQTVISKQNKDEIFGVIDLAAKLNVSELILSNLQPTTLQEQNLVLYKRYENKEMREFLNTVQIHAMRKAVKIKLPAYELKTERRCRFVDEDTATINFKGEVVPCYRFAHDGKEVVFGREKIIKSYSFGNIKKSSLREIWESSKYKKFCSTIYNNHYPSCIDCDLVEGCDLVNSASGDCYGNEPACSDCLWSRNFTFCI